MRKLTIQDWSDLVLFKQLLLNYEDIVPWTLFVIPWNFFFRRVVFGSAGIASQTQVVFLVTTPALASFVFYFFFIFLKPIYDHFHRQSFPCFFLCTFFSIPGALIVIASSEVRGVVPPPLTYAKTANNKGGGTPPLTYAKQQTMNLNLCKSLT